MASEKAYGSPLVSIGSDPFTGPTDIVSSLSISIRDINDSGPCEHGVALRHAAELRGASLTRDVAATGSGLVERGLSQSGATFHRRDPAGNVGVKPQLTCFALRARQCWLGSYSRFTPFCQFALSISGGSSTHERFESPSRPSTL